MYFGLLNVLWLWQEHCSAWQDNAVCS